MANDAYNDGWADATKYYSETHYSIEEVIKHFDNFFDRINDLKGLLYGVVDAKSWDEVNALKVKIKEELSIEKGNKNGKKRTSEKTV